MRRYVELWRLPSAPLLIVAGIVGRLPAGAVPLALLLFVADRSGSYAVAGISVGVYGVATAAVAPLLGRVADRRGFTLVLLGTGVGYPVAVAILVIAALAGAPTLVTYLTAALAGALVPLLTSSLRAIWADLASGDAARQTAFALDSIAMEVVWVAGPVLVAGAIAVSSVAVGSVVMLVGGAVAALGGSLAVAASGPIRRWRPTPVEAGARRRNPLRAPGMLTLLIAAFALLFATGSMEAAIAAFTSDAGRPALSGVLLAVWGIGSGIGGLWFGARQFAASTTAQYRWTLLACAAGMLPLAFLGTPWLMGLVLFLGGTAIAPTLTVQNSLLADLAPAGSVAESFTWLTTVTYTAVAAGTAVGGALVDRPNGVAAALLLAAGSALAAWAVAAVPGTRLNPRRLREA